MIIIINNYALCTFYYYELLCVYKTINYFPYSVYFIRKNYKYYNYIIQTHSQ